MNPPHSIVALIGATAVHRHDGRWVFKGRDPVTGRCQSLAAGSQDEWVTLGLPPVDETDVQHTVKSAADDDEERLLAVCSNTLLVSNLRTCLWAKGKWRSVWMRPPEGTRGGQVQAAAACVAMDKVHVALVVGSSNTLVTTSFPFTPTFPPPLTLPPTSWTAWHDLGQCTALTASPSACFAAILTTPYSSSLCTWGMNNAGQLGLGTVTVGENEHSAWHATPLVPDALDGLDAKCVHLTSGAACVIVDACVMVWGSRTAGAGEVDVTVPSMLVDEPVWSEREVGEEEWVPTRVWCGWGGVVVRMEREGDADEAGVLVGYGEAKAVERLVDVIKHNTK
ncbi:hypothetical protein BCR44DRAFT_64217 [Catenaria anguillulae PL171]|uniref:Regulator of chromosome condensation 1/beta-lactamase-inhibitor protein II n=1 Tax=Catenaria anguillulae PL171 TaxID=765915 RepID=A0A1Y2HGZ5_9FUNG|nr:hypothetical protein BCR44DRAFT_64217 [Catenaria anguillulae PL171]